MSILRQYEIKHYGGPSSRLPSELPYGDTYFAEDTGVLYKYNLARQPIAINPDGGGGLNFSQSVDTFDDLASGTLGQLAYVRNSQGTPWLPFTLGGTYYPAGIYYNDGASWISDRNAISKAIEDLNIRTGWASYNDTQYTDIAPFTVLANTPTMLPNNAGNVVDLQKPGHVTSYWDSITQTISGRNGDNLDIMLYWKAVPSNTNAELKIWIDITGGTGTPANLANLYEETKLFRGTDAKGVLYALPSAYTLGTWEANGGEIWVEPSVNMDMYGFVFNFDTSHKAR